MCLDKDGGRVYLRKQELPRPVVGEIRTAQPSGELLARNAHSLCNTQAKL